MGGEGGGLLWMPSSHPSVPATSHSVFPFRMFTRLVALERSQWVVSRLVSSSLPCSSPLLPPTSPLKLSPSRCITSPCLRLFPETTLVSTRRTFLSRISVVVWLLVTARTIHQRRPPPSPPKLLS